MFITVKQSPCQIGDRGRHVYTAEDVASRLPDPEQAGHDAEQDRRPDQRRGCDRRISKAARQAQPARQARSPRGGRIDWPQPPSRRPPKRSPHEATAEKIAPARTKGRIISSINFRTRLFLGSLAERSALLAARRLLVGRLRHPSRFGAGCPLRPYRWRHSDCVFAGAGPVARNLRGSYRLPRESALNVTPHLRPLFASTIRGCSSATEMCIRRLAYDNRSHPVLRLRRFIGSRCEWQAFTGPAQRYPAL